MNPSRKRPLGITLLALPFLWIGCGGTLVFPIVLLSGGIGQLIDWWTGDFIHSENLRLTIACAVALIWFGCYVLYAFIGFGLWKLRRWGWKILIVVQVVCLAIGLIGAACCYREPFLAAAVAVFALMFCGIFLWYLDRPNVRVAFQVEDIWHLNHFGTPGWIRLPKMKLWVGITIAAVVGVALFCGLLLFAVNGMFRKSDAYAMPLDEAQKSPCAVSKLGSPIVAKGFMSGSLETSDTTGSADMEIPVRGPKGKGTLVVSAKEADGVWGITSLTLDAEGAPVQLIPATAAPCQ